MLFRSEIVGFVDDRAGDAIGYRGLPVLGTLADVADACQDQRVDEIYVALPLEEHVANVIQFMRVQADALGLRGTL